MLNRSNAEEFLEVYKGVVTDYAEMLDEITSGPVIALEVLPLSTLVSPLTPPRCCTPRAARSRLSAS